MKKFIDWMLLFLNGRNLEEHKRFITNPDHRKRTEKKKK
jgi:hypothetical protein